MTLPYLADPMNSGNAPGDGPLRRGGTPASLPMAEANLPSTPSDAARRQAPAVTIVRDLWGGNEAVKGKSTAYLPKAPREKATNYSIRLARSVYHNYFRRTVEGLVGFVFRKDPELSEDVPPVIAQHWENIDNAGTHGDVFLRDLMADAMVAGHAAILVDYPAVTTGLRLSDEQDMGIRPYWVPLKKENLFSWRTTLEHGRLVLTQLVVREAGLEPDGAFGEREVVRWRVFRRERLETGRTVVGFELLRVTDQKVVVRDAFGLYPTQTEIPVVEVPTSGRVGLFQSDPPLGDLGALNVAHYQQWSDYATSMHMTCVPILFTAGFSMVDESGASVEVGPNAGLNTENAAAKAEYVSHDGAALTACKAALDDLKADMGALGLSMLAPDRKAAETATANKLDKAAESSALAVTARGVQDATERALQLHANYLRLPAGGSVTINREYEGAVMDAAVMQAYAVLADKLGVPDAEIVKMLVRGGRLAEDIDIDAVADEMGAARAGREDAAQVDAELAAAKAREAADELAA